MNKTANQRDVIQAVQWAVITAAFTAILCFTFLTAIESFVLNSFKVIDIDAKPLQIFSIYLSHSTHISFLKLFDINNISLDNLNETLKDSKILLYVEYIIYTISLISAVFAYNGEYKNNMVNERFISGVRYFKDFTALSEFKKYMLTRGQCDGVKIGGVEITRDLETKHLAIIGKSGGGKTVALWPVLTEAIKRGDKVILFDNKGDFTKIIIDKNGQQPVIIAPWDARGAAWDIAKDCRTTADAAELSNSFIEASSDPMWSEGAKQILTGLICKLQSDKQENWGWSDLAELLYVDMNDVEKIMKKYYKPGLRAVESIKNEEGESEGAGKTTQSLLITMSAQLSSVFRMAEAWQDTEEKFCIKDFLAGNLKSEVVILQGNNSLLNLQNACVKGIIAMLSSRINSPSYEERKPSAPGLWVFLDEFAQLGKISGVKEMLAIGRSKGVRVVMGWQNPSQLYEIFEHDGATAMLDIFGSYLFCSLGSDASKWASEAVGQQKIERFKLSTSISNGAASTSTSWDSIEEPAIKPVDLTQGLGVDIKAGGCWSIFWPVGGDTYKLLFKFNDAPDVRKPHQAAAWINPAWDVFQENSDDVKIIDLDAKEIEEKLLVLSKNISAFLSKTIKNLNDVEDFESLAVITNENHTEADFEEPENLENNEMEENSNLEEDFDLTPVFESFESHENQGIEATSDAEDDLDFFPDFEEK